MVLTLAVLATRVAALSQGHFVPPHSDSGLDTDGDGLYNYLRLEINVTATIPGTFYLSVDLKDGANFSFIAFGSLNTYVSGNATLTIDLYGPYIRASGIDGPYQANLYLYDDSFHLDDYNAHVTAAYLHDDFNGLPATFNPPYSDEGVDTNANSLFDVLEVNVSLNVSTAGTYRILGSLFDSSFNFIDSGSSEATLTPGIHTVPLTFTGWAIYRAGRDGPYTAFLDLYDESFRHLASDSYTTRAYRFTDFERPPAALAPPHSDRGVDRDGDGLFNAIAVDVNVSVAQAGTYQVTGSIYDVSTSTFLGFAFVTEFLDVGRHAVQLNFSTLPMVVSGISGRYTVSLALYTTPPESLDSGVYQTAAYSLSSFDPIPAHFSPPHSDRGVDRNTPPDGQFNILEVDVQINVSDAHTYELIGNLFDSSGTRFITSDTWFGQLPPGIQAVPLYLPGVTIRSSGIDGPYYLNLTLYVIEPGTSGVRIDAQGYGTRPYNATDFQSTTPADLSGVVRDAQTGSGIPFASVAAFDYLDLFSTSTTADAAGRYDLGLFAGDWVVVYDGSNAQAELQRVSLSGPTVHDVALGPQRTIVDTAELDFASWDSAGMRTRSIFELDNATFRLQYDWVFGNQDEYLDQEEFDAVLAAFGFMTPSAPPTSEDSFLVDGISFDLVPGSGSFAFVNITGPIDSPVPPEFDVNGAYMSSQTIPTSTSHAVRIHATYDSGFTTNTETIRLPAPFALENFTATSLVNVTGLGTATAVVDPGLDPNPFDSVTGEWVSLDAESTDTTGPTVSGASALPDPAELGELMTILAQITDASGVQSAYVEIRDPTGAVLGNFSMSSLGSTYTKDLIPYRTGTYTYEITVMDGVGNTAVVNGAFDVRDTSPPSAVAGPDQTVSAGTTVTFDGFGSDVGGISGYTWTFDDNGPKTLTGPNPTYRFDNPGTFTVTLTVTDSSGNTATDTVLVTVTGTTGSIQGPGPLGLAVEILALLALIAVAVIVALLLIRRRGRRPKPPDETPPPPSP